MKLADLLSWRFALTYLGIALSVIAVLVVWSPSRKTPGARAFFWWLVAAAVSNVAGFALGLTGRNNNQLFLVYRLVSVGLLGLTAFRMLSTPTRRRIAICCVVGYAVFWGVMTIGGIESLTWLSSYTSPAQKAVGTLIGLLLVTEAIQSSDRSPFHHPGAWLGIGLVLSCATSMVMSPIAAEIAHRSPDDALRLRQMAGMFNNVAIVLWCIPYWKGSVVWTR